MPSNHLVSVTHFSRPQSFLASGSFPMNRLFTSGGLSIGASVSASIFPVNIQGWRPLGLIGLNSLQSKGLSKVFSNTTIWKHPFFSSQPSLWSNSHSMKLLSHLSVQFSSVTQLCPTLCNPMNRSTPGLPVHDKLPEFTQTHARWVGDAIQPSHPLSSPSPPAPNPSKHQGLFQWVKSSHL